VLVPVSLLLTVLIWWVASAASSPILFPGPLATVQAAFDLAGQGVLLGDVLVTLSRVVYGFLLGCLVGVVLGLAMGQFRPIRWLLEPYVETLRFVTPVALLGIVVVWFGLSEMGKVFLIFYSTVFIVLLNTMIGVLHVPAVTVRAARSLGANPLQLFFRITIPSTVPYVVSSMRMAMGNAFMTVVAAEMIFANSGIGYLIGSAREFFRTDQVFVGIFLLGSLGFLIDRLLRIIAGRFGEKYGVRF
jgi:NitT/TauT family transport system permease protein